MERRGGHFNGRKTFPRERVQRVRENGVVHDPVPATVQHPEMTVHGPRVRRVVLGGEVFTQPQVLLVPESRLPVTPFFKVGIGGGRVGGGGVSPEALTRGRRKQRNSQ